jgi:hypothetical protein
MATITFQPSTLDLKLYAGDGFGVAFKFADKATGDPFPVAGVWAAEVRAPASAADALTSFAIDDSAAATGVIAISLTGDQVRTIMASTEATWDLQQTEPGAEPRTWYRGRITAGQDVTR